MGSAFLLPRWLVSLPSSAQGFFPPHALSEQSLPLLGPKIYGSLPSPVQGLCVHTLHCCSVASHVDKLRT